MAWAPALGPAVLQAVLSFYSPVLGLCFFAAALPFDYIMMNKAPITVFSGEALVTGLVLGLGFRFIVKRPRLERSAAHIMLWLVPLAAAAALSAIYAGDRWAVLKQFLRWAQLWLVFAAVVQSVRDQRAGGRLAASYFIIAVALSILGLAEVLAGPDSWLNSGIPVLHENPLVMRAHGPFHPNAFAPYLAIALLFWANWRHDWAQAVPAPLVWLGAVLAVVALVLTQSRTGWIAAVAAFAVWGLLRFRRPVRSFILPAMAAVVAIVVVALMVPSLRGRVLSLAQPWKAPSFQFRMEAFKAGLRVWEEHPLTGIGAGNYAKKFEEIKGSLKPWVVGAMRSHAHNFYLQTGIETGVIGLVVWMAALVWLAALFWRGRRVNQAAAVLGMGVLALFVVGNSFELMVVHSRGVMFALGWGAAAGMLGSGRKPRSVKPRGRSGTRK